MQLGFYCMGVNLVMLCNFLLMHEESRFAYFNTVDEYDISPGEGWKLTISNS